MCMHTVDRDDLIKVGEEGRNLGLGQALGLDQRLPEQLHREPHNVVVR